MTVYADAAAARASGSKAPLFSFRERVGSMRVVCLQRSGGGHRLGRGGLCPGRGAAAAVAVPPGPVGNLPTPWSRPTITTRRSWPNASRFAGSTKAYAIARAQGRPQVTPSAYVGRDLVTLNLGANGSDLTVSGTPACRSMPAPGSATRCGPQHQGDAGAPTRATRATSSPKRSPLYDVIPRPLDRQLNQNHSGVLETICRRPATVQVRRPSPHDVAHPTPGSRSPEAPVLRRGRLRASEENSQGDRHRGCDLKPPNPLPTLPGPPTRRPRSRSATMPISPHRRQARAAGYDSESLRRGLPTFGDDPIRSPRLIGTANTESRPAPSPTARPAPRRLSLTGRSTRAARPALGSGRRAPSRPSCSRLRSRSSEASSRPPGRPMPASEPRRRRSNRTRSPSPPTSSRSRAPAPSKRSAPATCSTCSMPSRSCSTARCCSSPLGATPMSPASSCSTRWAPPRPRT